MSPWESGAHVALLQNSAGHTLRGPKLRRAQLEGSKTPRGKFAFNVCPAFSWRHIFGGLDIHKNHLTIWFSVYFKGYFCKPLSFQRSIQPIWQFFREKIFHGTVPLKLSGSQKNVPGNRGTLPDTLATPSDSMTFPLTLYSTNTISNNTPESVLGMLKTLSSTNILSLYQENLPNTHETLSCLVYKTHEVKTSSMVDLRNNLIEPS